MRERIPVVVQGRRTRRSRAARALWTGAELAVTLGAVLLLLVVHQLWWTNRQAQHSAQDQVDRLERRWGARPPSFAATPAPEDDGAGARGSGKSTPPPGTTGRRAADRPLPPQDLAYAVLRIPRIGVTAPIAQGVGKAAVLNKGYVGHYPHSAQPGEAGNVALAGHRNTHGEPFRYIGRLRPGDTVVIDTAEARYTYAVRRTLPETTPGDGTVLAKVPYSSVHPAYRFTAPGAYLTLTTCTPEYTSTYRLVVWGVLRSTQSR
ncbi:class E sortase [Streptomyces inhibens]|uniref:class E sortase n=1 Tax=Streptomyces inhibens TaxID=2293571 RepID=UPI001EE6E097|nr:class E sortase [Streptomyces inhibens]UKY50474.1 class E sortase [Streptomyces inhibens]